MCLVSNRIASNIAVHGALSAIRIESERARRRGIRTPKWAIFAVFAVVRMALVAIRIDPNKLTFAMAAELAQATFRGEYDEWL